MKVVVLAAGYATRLYPLTENFPKPLLQVNGKSILDYLIEDLDRLDDVNEHIIISNAKFAHIFEEWAEKSNYTKPVTVLNDGTMNNETRLGAVKDILFAIEEKSIDEDIFVLAGDNLVDFSLGKFLEFAKQKDGSSVIVNYEESIEELRRCGVMVPDENMRIVSMEEKPYEPKSNWCVGPFYYYRREDLKWVKQGIEDGCGVDAPGSFVCYLCEKIPVYATDFKRFLPVITISERISLTSCGV